jgi:hypothetical protein
MGGLSAAAGEIDGMMLCQPERAAPGATCRGWGELTTPRRSASNASLPLRHLRRERHTARALVHHPHLRPKTLRRHHPAAPAAPLYTWTTLHASGCSGCAAALRRPTARILQQPQLSTRAHLPSSSGGINSSQLLPSRSAALAHREPCSRQPVAGS